MSCKKTPERFTIRFNASVPLHQKVIDILLKKGRKASRYIVDAVIAYESRQNDTANNDSKSFRNTESVQESNSDNDFNYDEIFEALDTFKQ